MIGTFLLTAIWLILPGYAANSFPVLLKGILKPLAVPIDFGKKIGGIRIFGDHKTVRGFIVGLIGSIGIMGGQAWLAGKYESIAEITILPFDEYNWALLGFLMGFGVLAGDAIESFFKRRVGIKPGKSWFPFDQLDALIGAYAILAIVFRIPWGYMLFFLLFIPVLHLSSNVVAYWLKIKETWT